MLEERIRGALPKAVLNNEVNEAIILLNYLIDNGLATVDDYELLSCLERR